MSAPLFRETEVVRPASYVVPEDARELEDLAHKWRKDLERLRGCFPPTEELRPSELAVLCILVAFRGYGVQWPVRFWCDVLGFSERAVQYALKELEARGLCERFDKFAELPELQAHRPPAERVLELRRMRRGLEVSGTRVQVYSITYATAAGAELLSGYLGTEVETRGRRTGLWRGGFMGRIARAVVRVLRTLARRISKTENPAPGAEVHCTPYAAKQRKKEASPSFHTLEVPPPLGACGKPEPLAARPPSPLEQLLTAEDRAAGSVWQGGGPEAFAELVHRCATAGVWVPAVEPGEWPARPSWFERDHRSGRRRKAWHCPKCGGRDGRHAEDCPRVGMWRESRGRLVWAPAPILTAERAWPEEWRDKPSLRTVLLELFEPVRRAVARRVLQPRDAGAAASSSNPNGAEV